MQIQIYYAFVSRKRGIKRARQDLGCLFIEARAIGCRLQPPAPPPRTRTRARPAHRLPLHHDSTAACSGIPISRLAKAHYTYVSATTMSPYSAWEGRPGRSRKHGGDPRGADSRTRSCDEQMTLTLEARERSASSLY